MRFVVQIGADDRRVAGVARRQHRPIADPTAFGIGRGVPQSRFVGAVAGVGAMMIEHDPQADLPGVVDDLVHDLQAAQPLQIGILREVDAVGRAAGVEQLIRSTAGGWC